MCGRCLFLSDNDSRPKQKESDRICSVDSIAYANERRGWECCDGIILLLFHDRNQSGNAVLIQCSCNVIIKVD